MLAVYFGGITERNLRPLTVSSFTLIVLCGFCFQLFKLLLQGSQTDKKLFGFGHGDHRHVVQTNILAALDAVNRFLTIADQLEVGGRLFQNCPAIP